MDTQARIVDHNFFLFTESPSIGDSASSNFGHQETSFYACQSYELCVRDALGVFVCVDDEVVFGALAVFVEPACRVLEREGISSRCGVPAVWWRTRTLPA